MAIMQDGDYPFRGYVYTREGFHDEGIELGTHSQLQNFMFRVVPIAMKDRVEIRVTDSHDYLVFHANNGKIIWPKEEH